MELIRPLGPDAPAELRYTARLGTAPHYAGSFHDDAYARSMGYARALVPGAFLYGAMSHLAVASWGLDWAARGAIEARFLRPCHDGEELAVTATPLVENRAEVAVTRADGEVVATGALALPDAAPPPPAAAIRPLPPEPPVMVPGGMRAGTPLGSHDEVLTAEQHRQALADFGETFGAYAAQGVIHTGRLLRAIMRDANANWRFPTPVILTACTARHYGLAHAGARIATAGAVSAVREHKGNHYFETSQLLTADRRPVALFRCTQVYAARRQGA